MYQVWFEVMLLSNVRRKILFHVLLFYVLLVPTKQISQMC
jgi:hypothetical protein